MRGAVINDDLQPIAELCEARYDIGLVRLIGHNSDLGFLVLDRLVEHLEDRLPRLEAHPC
jgi:hypothetical protein